MGTRGGPSVVLINQYTYINYFFYQFTFQGERFENWEGNGIMAVEVVFSLKGTNNLRKLERQKSLLAFPIILTYSFNISLKALEDGKWIETSQSKKFDWFKNTLMHSNNICLLTIKVKIFGLIHWSFHHEKLYESGIWKCLLAFRRNH